VKDRSGPGEAIRPPGARRFVRVLAIAIPGLLLAVGAGLTLGSVSVPLRELFSGDPTAQAILALRLSRVALAALVGASLALAGAALQSLLKNPLADPFLLGTSGGAAAGAVVASVAGAATGVLPAAAFAGAAIATVGVAALSRRGGRVDLNRLLLSGVVANSFFSAAILGLLAFASGATTKSMVFWMMGSLADASPSGVFTLSAYLLVGGLVLLLFARDLNLFLVGEDNARALGVSTETTKISVFLAASLLTGAAVALVGVVGFVGLVVPHLARLSVGGDQKFVLPLSALFGAGLLVISDVASRFLLSPAEIPIGAVTALAGVPFFLVLLRRSA
jgi:ABC-type Fe3+-siderophore transport system permease subunit